VGGGEGERREVKYKSRGWSEGKSRGVKVSEGREVEYKTRGWSEGKSRGGCR